MSEPGHAGLAWRKSSASGGENCLEVAADRVHVYLRHSGARGGPVLTLLHGEWDAFVVGALNGEFGLSVLQRRSEEP